MFLKVLLICNCSVSPPPFLSCHLTGVRQVISPVEVPIFWVCILTMLPNVCDRKCGAPPVDILSRRIVPKSDQTSRAKYCKSTCYLLNVPGVAT